MHILFTNRITRTRIQNSEIVKLPFYEGTETGAHDSFWTAIGRTYLDDEEKEARYFRFIVEHQSGPTLEWFSKLKENSVDNFEQLSTAFVKHYSMFVETSTSDAHLWRLQQEQAQSFAHL